MSMEQKHIFIKMFMRIHSDGDFEASPQSITSDPAASYLLSLTPISHYNPVLAAVLKPLMAFM